VSKQRAVSLLGDIGAPAPLSPTVCIKGAGEMASAVACRLHASHIRRICMLDLPNPLAVRRSVSFCTALAERRAVVEGITAVPVHGPWEIEAAWRRGQIAVSSVHDDSWLEALGIDVLIDAILAKHNAGTDRGDAPLVIALGPGFTAGSDCHFVIETNRGHDLGRVIESGSAAPNTSTPGTIAGYSRERLLRAPVAGQFTSEHGIGERISKGNPVGYIEGQPVTARIDGVLRGLIRPGTLVSEGLKLGDIDPRAESRYCYTISDKARAIAGSVLECVLRHYNRPPSQPERWDRT